MTRLLRPDEAAAHLSIPRSTVIALARGSGLPHIRVGRLYRFPEDALDAWIVARTSYTRGDGEGGAQGERVRVGPSSKDRPKAVGRRAHGRVDARRPAHPPQPLRIVETGG